MKKIMISAIVVLTTMISYAQRPAEKSVVQNSSAVIYRLYPTQNMWTLIKLDTRNGKMWLLQYSMKEENRFATALSLEPRVLKEEEENDRFALYPTQNLHTFILADQFDGRTWQVQWGQENRFVVPIN